MIDVVQLDFFNVPAPAFEASLDCCSCSLSWKNSAFIPCSGSRLGPEEFKLLFCKRNKLDDRFHHGFS